MNKKRLIQIMLGTLCALSLAAVIFLSIRYSQEKRTALAEIKQEAQKETRAAAQKIGHVITMLEPLVNELAQELSDKQLSEKEITKRLQKKPVTVSGIGVSYEPEEAQKNRHERFAPYFTQKNGKQELINLEKEFDYTKPEHEWYHKPLKEGAQFLDNKLWTLTERVLIGFAAPFYKKEADNKKPAGIVFAHQTADHIKNILTTIYLGKTGYWFITSHDSRLLIHPYEKHETEGNKLHEIMNIQDEELRGIILDNLEYRTPSIIDYHNEIDGKPSLLFMEPIPSTSWMLFRVFPKEEIPMNHDKLRQILMLLSLSVILFLIFLVLLGSTFIELTTIRLWVLTFIVSGLLGLELILLWFIIWRMPPYEEDLIPIRDKVSLYAFLDTLPKEHATHDKKGLQKRTTSAIEQLASSIRQEPSISENIQKILQYQCKHKGYIPTGIYITHLQLNTERQIEMTAHIWQRYYDGIHDDISRGFVLPQAKVTKKTELYRTKERDTETIIWQVRATLNQNLVYIKYPFDIKDIQIQIDHQDFAQNIILVPDLSSYKLIHPTALPGLSKEVTLRGWNIANSYFGYKITDYDTAFGLYSYGPLGIDRYLEKCNQPELYFNVTAQRYLGNTLVADLLPLAIIALLIFILLLTAQRQGFAILGTAASVFFGAIVAQARFRGKIEAFNLIYFETFYLVMYAALIVMILVSLLYTLNVNVPIVHYKKNLAVKLLFWPVILSMLLIITFRYFF